MISWKHEQKNCILLLAWVYLGKLLGVLVERKLCPLYQQGQFLYRIGFTGLGNNTCIITTITTTGIEENKKLDYLQQAAS